MFEKEAEEYAIEHEYEYDDIGVAREASYQAYIAGAEFAYNKANKWHKQDTDDIYDLIAEDWSIKYFICIMKNKCLVAATGNCDEDLNGGVSVNLLFEHDDDKYCLDDIIWWREIKLPKETKEDD